MTREHSTRLLIVLLLMAAGLRLYGRNWDQGHALHPDERFISMVEDKIKAPGPLEYFDSQRSPLNPYNNGYGSFVYGTLPMVLTKAISSAVGQAGYGRTSMVGRMLAALFDLLTIYLVYRITRRFASRGVSLAAVALLAFTPFAIQLSHFWTVDPFLTTFTAGAVLAMTRLAQGRVSWRSLAITGLVVGLAVSCKVTGLALLFPVGIALLVAAFGEWAFQGPRAAAEAIGRSALRLGLVLAVMLLTVRVAFPYAFLGPSPFSFKLDPRWISDLKQLTNLSSSVAGYPPALQWAGRTILFPLQNIVLWGMGPLLGLSALAALVWAAYQVFRRRALVLLPLVVQVLFVLLYHGLTLAKTMRYFYPAYPGLVVLAALGLHALGVKRGRPRVPLAVVLAGTVLSGLAFSAIYTRPHSRVQATRWIYEHVPPGKLFGNETWDDGLPLGLPGHDSSAYSGPMLDFWAPDNHPAKLPDMLRKLDGADWIAVTSNRVYGNVTRIPDVFPVMIAYYRALFEERLGFRLAAEFTSYPSLFGLTIPDDSSEEQFTVYDHPRVLLFEKTKDYSPERVRQILRAALPAARATMQDWETWPRARRLVVAPVRPVARPDRRPPPALVQESSAVQIGSVTNSLWAAIRWYVVLALLGLLALPIAFRVFSRLEDRGFGLSRALATAFVTLLVVALVTARVLSNGRAATFLCLGVMVVVSVLLARKEGGALARFLWEKRRMLLFQEGAFLAGFTLFLAIRALNPEIFWGEKPMDFSILNILVRTRTFPASDPWFAGAPLGYYVFGQQMVAVLGQLTGLDTRLTFNLAFAFLGGTVFQGATSVLWSLAGTRAAAIAGSVLLLLTGNLAGLRLLLTQKKPMDWHYFWATSRIVPGAINEYPFWSLVFADLHAHVLAWPVFLLVLAAAIQVVRTASSPFSKYKARLGEAAVFGVFAALLVLTNAWEVPFLAGLTFLVFAVLLLSPGSLLRRLATAVGFVVVAAATALLVARPLWVRSGGSPGIGRNFEEPVKALDIFTIFGLFIYLAFAWWLHAARDRFAARGMPRAARIGILAGVGVLLAVLTAISIDFLAAAGVVMFVAAAIAFADRLDDSLTMLLAAAGFFLIGFADRVYIYDRMNTFFKLHLEAWLVLSLSCGVLLFRGRERLGSFSRWSWPAQVPAYVLAALAAFTTVTAGYGALTDARPTLKGFSKTPTLDGLRYLAETNPGEYRAVLWLRQTLKGTPVVLEAYGPSYQEFGRISMLTGLPTVAGWDHHVKQRGNSPEELEERKAAVESIYTTADAALAESLLRRYHVGYVVVGQLERTTYGAAGLAKFDGTPLLFALVYENPQVRVYRVVGGDSEDVALAKEKLPPPPKPAAGGKPEDEPEEPPSIGDKPEEGRPPFSGMREPRDAAVDDKGRIWIADFGNYRLRVFDPQGGFLGGWGGRGSGTYGLREPCAVAVGKNGIYVADTWNGRVQGHELNGEWKATATGFFGPRGVAIDEAGRVWITDTGNGRVVICDSSLAQLQVVGAKGKEPGQFEGPVGIAAGGGKVFVADTGNRRIQVFDQSGAAIGSWKVPWKEYCEAHVEVDASNRVFVSDPTGNRVLVYDATGQLLSEITSDRDKKAFVRPMGVALDPASKTLYVVNAGNSTVGRVDVSK